MPLAAANKRDLNISLLRNKSHDEVVTQIKALLGDSTDPVVYRLGYSFAAYLPAMEAVVKEAHTIVTDGKAKNIVIPYHLVCA